MSMKRGPWIALTVVLCLPAVAQAQGGQPAIVGVEPGAIYNHSVTIHLANAAAGVPVKLTLNGTVIPDGTTVSRDGHYLVEAREVGPLYSPNMVPPVRFTIDTTPPVVSFVRPSWLPAGALPRVKVVDENPDPHGVKLTLDGRPHALSQPVPAGEHELSATVTDKAGNVASTSESFVQSSCIPSSWVEYQRPSTILTAAHYYTWYTGSPDCPADTKWCDCVWQPKVGNPEPARGFYDSGSQSVVDAQLDQMQSFGIDVVSLEWTGATANSNHIQNLIVPALQSRSMKYVLLYDLAIRMNGDFNLDHSLPYDRLVQDFQTFASSTSYFKNPKYLKFTNRPVVYIYVTRAITGSDSRISSAFAAIEQAAQDNGFAGVYIVADHLWWSQSFATLPDIQPRAVTAFAPVSSSEGVPEGNSSRPIRTWADKIAGTLYPEQSLAQYGAFDLEPGIFPQYDDKGLDQTICNSRPQTHDWLLLDGSDWSYMIQTLGVNRAALAERHVLFPSCRESVYDNGTNGAAIVWVYSYNEWYEASGIEQLSPRSPAYPYGFGTGPLSILEQALP